jgi:murein DD-endopeptidase MepM/ murein hydrolase activator NlpD
LKIRKRKTKFFTFLLIPDNEKATKSLKLGTTTLRILIVVAAVALVLVISGAASYWKVAAVALDYNRLHEENQQLKKNLTRLKDLQTDIDKLKQVDQQLRSSLSGYVTMVEDKNADPDLLMKNGLDQISDPKHDRSIFNSIPSEMPLNGFITRGFETTSILSNAHIGIDIAAEMGSPVKATADGVVVFSDWTFNDGYVIILQHKYNFFSFYKHNMQNLCQKLETVKKGQIIARLGDTGQITSGAHLHFEIWQGTKPIDPIEFLQIKGI